MKENISYGGENAAVGVMVYCVRTVIKYVHIHCIMYTYSVQLFKRQHRSFYILDNRQHRSLYILDNRQR